MRYAAIGQNPCGEVNLGTPIVDTFAEQQIRRAAAIQTPLPPASLRGTTTNIPELVYDGYGFDYNLVGGLTMDMHYSPLNYRPMRYPNYNVYNTYYTNNYMDTIIEQMANIPITRPLRISSTEMNQVFANAETEAINLAATTTELNQPAVINAATLENDAITTINPVATTTVAAAAEASSAVIPQRLTPSPISLAEATAMINNYFSTNNNR